MSQNVLRTEHVTQQFGGVIAVNDLNIEVNEHEIIALIGPNGAGKTTAFNDITGVYKPTQGKVIYTGKDGKEIDITGKNPVTSPSWASPARSRTSACSRT